MEQVFEHTTGDTAPRTGTAESPAGTGPARDADPAEPPNIQTHTGAVHAPGRYDKALRTRAPRCCASRTALLRYHYLTPVRAPVTCKRCLAILAKEAK